MRARKDAIAKVAKSNQAYKLNILVKQFLFFFFLLRVETILSVSITASGRKNGPTPTGIPIDLASYQQPVHMDPKREAARNAGGCIGLFLYSSGKSTTSAFRWKRWGADCPEWGGESRSSPRMCVVRSLLRRLLQSLCGLNSVYLFLNFSRRSCVVDRLSAVIIGRSIRFSRIRWIWKDEYTRRLSNIVANCVLDFVFVQVLGRIDRF